MLLSGIKKEEITIKAKYFIHFISHLVHDLLGNIWYCFVNTGDCDFPEVK